MHFLEIILQSPIQQTLVQMAGIGLVLELGFIKNIIKRTKRIRVVERRKKSVKI